MGKANSSDAGVQDNLARARSTTPSDRGNAPTNRGTGAAEDGPGRVADAGTGQTNAAREPILEAPLWQGENVVLYENAFNGFRQFFEADAAHLRYLALTNAKKQLIGDTFRPRTGIELGVGVLQINLNHKSTSNSFGWSLLTDVIASNESVLIMPSSSTMPDEFVMDLPDGSTYTYSMTRPIKPALGFTYITRPLQKMILAKSPDQKNRVTEPSSSDKYSLILLFSGIATPKTIIHELLGHFWLAAAKKLPYKDRETLSPSIRTPDGKPFVLKGIDGRQRSGTVREFIEMHISKEML